MKYMGSKSRIAKEILPIILKDRFPNQAYVEPFVGGCNIIDKVDGIRYGNDNNEYLIAMWQGFQLEDEFPIKIPKSLYNEARHKYHNGRSDILMDRAIIGWIGFMASFNGRFFDGGYSGQSKGRDYIDEQIRNTEKQIPHLKDVIFSAGDYSEMYIPKNSIIYCDPPYANTKQYSTSQDFDHDKFWQWCRDMALMGHTIFISEYKAPDDFECVWSKKVTNSLNTTKTYKPTEKLFTIKPKQ